MIRYEFIDLSIKEEDIHPEAIYHKERDLAKKLVKGTAPSEKIQPCPLCGAARNEILFEKWGHRYAVCPRHFSIALSSMPDQNLLHKYFYDSELSQLRASKEVQDIITSKRKELWKGQIEWIEGRVTRYLGNDKYNTIDWGSKSSGWIE